MNEQLEKITSEFVTHIQTMDAVLGELLSQNLTGGFWHDDVSRLEKTYWYHANMTDKYLKRKDFFKLNAVMYAMLEAHMSLLLVAFDKIAWGGRENKLNFLPAEKQAHLKKYYCSEDFKETERNLIKCMRAFQADAREVCALKGLAYSERVGNLIMEHWLNGRE